MVAMNPPAQASLTGLTPSGVEVLVYYHAFGCTPHPRHFAPAVAQARNELIELMAIEPCSVDGNKIIRRSDFVDLITPRPTTPGDYSGCMTFITTPLGAEWVERLCAVPLPMMEGVEA